jgi:Ca2+-transporting ATPase
MMAAATLSVVFWSWSSGDPPALVATCGFLTLAFVQITHVGNARSRFAVLAPQRVIANPYALGAVALVVVLQVAAVTWPPLVRVLRTVTPPLDAWLVIVLAAASVGVAGQIIKLLGTRRRAVRLT